MKVLLERSYAWTPEDAQRDIPFAFCCPSDITELRISFSYAPSLETEEERCRPQVEKALRRYYDCYPHTLQPMDANRFLPVKNLITLSLDKDGVYLGNAHRWDPKQEHILNIEWASRGFVPPKQMAGDWTGMLHLHEIISPCCEAQLKIEGRAEG